MSPPPLPPSSHVEADASPSGGAEPVVSNQPEPALHNLGAQLRFWATVMLGLGLDLWSKHWAFHTLRQDGHRTLIPNVLEFDTTLNPGALFGIGRGQTGLFLVASVLALALVLWMFAQCPARRWLTHVALGAILAGALGNMYDRIFIRLVGDGVQTPQGPVARFYVLEESPDGRTLLLREYPPGAGSPVRTLPRASASKLEAPVGYVRDFIKIPTYLPRWSWIPAKFRGRELWPWVFNVADMLLVGGVGILALRLLRDRRPREAPAERQLDPAGEKS